MVHFCLFFCKNEPGKFWKKVSFLKNTKMTRGVVRKYGINVLNIDIGTKPLNANFVNASNPWMRRGGNYNNGSNAVAFNWDNNNGNANNNNGFRAVLSQRLQYIRHMSSIFNIQGYYKY